LCIFVSAILALYLQRYIANLYDVSHYMCYYRQDDGLQVFYYDEERGII
jgi:hypothetical protein